MVELPNLLANKLVEKRKRKLALLKQQGEMLLMQQKKRLIKKGKLGVEKKGPTEQAGHSSSSGHSEKRHTNESIQDKKKKAEEKVASGDVIKSTERPLCKFYARTGTCKRGKQCKFRHDPERRRTCVNFLRGECKRGAKCHLRHTKERDQMPVCRNFLFGFCDDDNCIYSHVRVNPVAPVCPAFLKGHCPLGDNCKMKHQRKRKPQRLPERKEDSLPNKGEKQVRTRPVFGLRRSPRLKNSPTKISEYTKPRFALMFRP